MKLTKTIAGFCLVLLSGAFLAGDSIGPVQSAALPKWCGKPLRAFEDTTVANVSVALVGTLVRRFELGPPGFGTSPKIDRKWVAWFLRLDFKTSVILMDPELAPERTIVVREIQVRGPLEYRGEYTEYLNRHVRVTGPFWKASDPSDLGEVVLEGRGIELARPIGCDGRERISNI